MTEQTQELERRVANIVGTSKNIQMGSVALASVSFLSLFPASLTGLLVMDYYRGGKQPPIALETVFYCSLGLMAVSTAAYSLGFGLCEKLERIRIHRLKKQYSEYVEKIDQMTLRCKLNL